jgi:hypothetical protein
VCKIKDNDDFSMQLLTASLYFPLSRPTRFFVINKKEFLIFF